MRTGWIFRTLAAVVLGAAWSAPLAAQQVTPPMPPPSLIGTAFDSVRGRPMDGAKIVLQGTALSAVAGPEGSFRIDSVPPGTYRLVTVDPILDSLGIQLVTPPIKFTAGRRTTLQIATPSPAALVKMLCPAAWLTRGPAALFGRVRNADTQQPIAKAHVSIVWYDIDVHDLSKIPRLREAMTQPDGTYRICGLPSDFDGKVQVDYAGIKSGDLPVAFHNSVVQVRSLSIASRAPVTVAAAGDTGRRVARPVEIARLSGRVIGPAGNPIAHARVQVEGTEYSANTGPDGSFRLDSLPAGSQVVRAMYLGYQPVEHSVELSSHDTARVTLQMQRTATLLPTVTTTAKAESGLQAVGFTQREEEGVGFFMDEKTVDLKHPNKFTDLLSSVPGLHVSGSGPQTTVRNMRDPFSSCVQYVVDGSPWTSLTPDDIDNFVQGEDVGAVEVYQGTEVPAQFEFPGQGNCTIVVAWTKWKLSTMASHGH